MQSQLKEENSSGAANGEEHKMGDAQDSHNISHKLEVVALNHQIMTPRNDVPA